jgi:hypothetical protein
MAIHKLDLPLSSVHSSETGTFRVSRCRRCGIVIGFGEQCDFCSDRHDEHVDQPGEYIGRHHTEWSTTVDQLIAQGDPDQAEFLLWRLLDAADAEAEARGAPPFERHYTRLTQVARGRKDIALEARIKERYEHCRRLAMQAARSS